MSEGSGSLWPWELSGPGPGGQPTGPREVLRGDKGPGWGPVKRERWQDLPCAPRSPHIRPGCVSGPCGGSLEAKSKLVSAARTLVSMFISVLNTGLLCIIALF